MSSLYEGTHFACIHSCCLLRHHLLQKAFMLMTVLAMCVTAQLQLCIIQYPDNKQDGIVDLSLGGHAAFYLFIFEQSSFWVSVCEFEAEVKLFLQDSLLIIWRFFLSYIICAYLHRFNFTVVSKSWLSLKKLHSCSELISWKTESHSH